MAHLKPYRLILLHSDDNESRTPAQRLKKFFDQGPDIIAKGATSLEPVPHDDYEKMQKRLDEVHASLPTDSECLLNFTGGNKLMATAAFRWAEGNHIRSFYLERGHWLTWFVPAVDGSGMVTESEKLDVTVTNALDPIALLRCQTQDSDVERSGERLTLSDSGKALDKGGFFQQLQHGDNPLDKGWLGQTRRRGPGTKSR